MVTRMLIHPTAIVSETAVIGAGSIIGPYAVIEDGAVLGENCSIAAHAILRRDVVLGDAVSVDSFAVIGGNPQSLTFDPATKSGVVIGNNVVIREGCTIHRGSSEGADTVLGDGCFLMAQAHIAHDCEVGKDVVIANNVMLGGHVTIGANVFIGGGVGIHQFCRIGTYVMIGGNASISADVPPYVMAAERNTAHGLNMVGLRRGGFERPDLADLKKCYRAVYFGAGNLKKKAAEAVREHEFGVTATGARFLAFFEHGKRGFVQSSNMASNK
jgi:UDP-N-acetylglucosamine acyltransferase